jgi:hypothetical protein
MVAMTIQKSVINFTYKYLLIPLNLSMIVWLVLMNHAYVRPTDPPTSYPIREKGAWRFKTIYLCCCLFTVIVGITNVVVLYCAFKNMAWRMNGFKRCTTFPCCRSVSTYRGFAVALLVLFGTYGLIASVAFRDVFAKRTYAHACDGYLLRADIYVRPDFPSYDGTTNSAPFDASSTIRLYKNNTFQYTMDLVRAYNQTLGFRQLGRPDDTGWGTYELVLRLSEKDIKGVDSNGQSVLQTAVEYFNATKMIENQMRGLSTTAPGPIGNIHYSLVNST